VAERPQVLFAHERPPIARSVERVLQVHGFEVDTVSDGAKAEEMLAGQHYDGLVVDVALPGTAGYELTTIARDKGVVAVILVASVYRRTSYKRRPSRLYGADDYVEVHHLGDQLPAKLRQHMGLPPVDLQGSVSQLAAEELRDEADTRMDAGTPERLATLIVADMILYNGDVIAGADSGSDLQDQLETDLDGARGLFNEVQASMGRSVAGDPIGDAFTQLMAHLRNDVEAGEGSS
jgi:CheY-like chemotaxis protein